MLPLDLSVPVNNEHTTSTKEEIPECFAASMDVNDDDAPAQKPGMKYEYML